MGLKNPGLPYWAWISFIDILELDLKNTWTNLLDSDLFYYNQEGMLLEKSEYLLELSVSDTIKINMLIPLVSLCLLCEKPNVCSRIRYSRIQQELSNLIFI